MNAHSDWRSPAVGKDTVLVFDARTARVLATIVLCGLGLAFVYLAWRTLVTFLFAILFAYLLEPAVGEIQVRLRMSRARAVAALYLILLVGLGSVLFTVGRRIVQQAAHLSELAPGLSAGVASGQIVRAVGNKRGWSEETQGRIQQFLGQHRATLTRWEQSVLGDLANLASNAGWVAVIPVLAIFFLLGGDRFFEVGLEQLARRRQRVFVANLLHDVHDVLAKYIRAQILLTTLTLIVYLVGLELLRLPYAVAIGVVAGLMEFIPVVGPLIGAVVVVTTAFVTGYPHLWILLVFLGVWRLTQDYVNSPRIMGNQVQLDPLAVLFGVFAGAEMAGVIGVYLSIPAMATLRVMWIRWRDFQDTALLSLNAPEGTPPNPLPPPG